jgi:hypothetical protein
MPEPTDTTDESTDAPEASATLAAGRDALRKAIVAAGEGASAGEATGTPPAPEPPADDADKEAPAPPATLDVAKEDEEGEPTPTDEEANTPEYWKGQLDKLKKRKDDGVKGRIEQARREALELGRQSALGEAQRRYDELAEQSRKDAERAEQEAYNAYTATLAPAERADFERRYREGKDEQDRQRRLEEGDQAKQALHLLALDRKADQILTKFSGEAAPKIAAETGVAEADVRAYIADEQEKNRAKRAFLRSQLFTGDPAFEDYLAGVVRELRAVAQHRKDLERAKTRANRDDAELTTTRELVTTQAPGRTGPDTLDEARVELRKRFLAASGR